MNFGLLRVLNDDIIAAGRGFGTHPHDGGALWINQDATFSIGDFEAGQAVDYAIKAPGNGAYIFIIEGSAKINGTQLNKRDAIGVYDTSSLFIENEALTRLLIMDIPMV